MRIGVIGTGHVGLVTCLSLTQIGHDVIGTDSDPDKIHQLQNGISPFFEPGLDRLLHESLSSGRLRFRCRSLKGHQRIGGRLHFGRTPPRASGAENLVAVEAAGRTVARHATGRCLVVEKSTVPTGTARRLGSVMRRERSDLGYDLEVASNPGFSKRAAR